VEPIDREKSLAKGHREIRENRDDDEGYDARARGGGGNNNK
jgi:hypothetical protein